MSYQEKALEQTQDMLGTFDLSADLSLCFTVNELEKVAGEREVWAYLL